MYQSVREAEKASLQDRAGGLCKEAGETEREREREKRGEWLTESETRHSSLFQVPSFPNVLLHPAPASWSMPIETQYRHKFSILSQRSSSNFYNIPPKNQLTQQVIGKLHSHSQWVRRFCSTTFPVRFPSWRPESTMIVNLPTGEWTGLQLPSGIHKSWPKDLVGRYSRAFVVRNNPEWNNLFPNYLTGPVQAHPAAQI